MKKIEYDDNKLIVVCPTCGKTILKDTKRGAGRIHPCEHLMLWVNSMETQEFAFTHKSLEQEAKDPSDARDVFLKLSKRHKFITHEYDGGYIGGCQYAVDWIAFQK